VSETKIRSPTEEDGVVGEKDRGEGGEKDRGEGGKEGENNTF